MDCPKCGALIPEGKLYCPQCGYAVQIVPDYDADLQENLESVGSDIAGNVNRIDIEENSRPEYDIDATTREIPQVSKEEAIDLKRKFEEDKRRSEMLVTWIVALALLVGVVVIAIFASNRLKGNTFIPGEAIDNAASNNAISIDEISNRFADDEINNYYDEELNAIGDEEEEDSLSGNRSTLKATPIPEPGNYSEPVNIFATISGEGSDDSKDAVIYYTTDKSEPDLDSRVLKHEIAMPIGESHFAFRVMDGDGNFGETVYADYNLGFAGICTAGDAVNICVAQLLQDGAILDIYGHVPGSAGTYTYKCDSMINSEGRSYFLIPEYYTDEGGHEKATGTTYAVDAISLGLFKTAVGPDGRYVFEMFY